MTRGELYLVKKPAAADPRKQRVLVIVSRQALLDTRFSTAICAPVYSHHDGLTTQLSVSLDVGLKSDSSIHCDELVSLPKTMLTNYVGKLSVEQQRRLDKALAVAVGLQNSNSPELFQ